MWECTSCGCLAIAASLQACPVCRTPRAQAEAKVLPQPPKAGAGSSLDAWIAYARQEDPDLSLDEAEAMSRHELIDKYGGGDE